MGGHIVTLMAEREAEEGPKNYHGVLGIGAALISKNEVLPSSL